MDRTDHRAALVQPTPAWPADPATLLETAVSLAAEASQELTQHHTSTAPETTREAYRLRAETRTALAAVYADLARTAALLGWGA